MQNIKQIVLSDLELNKILTSVVFDIVNKYQTEVYQILLFGSYAKGKAKPKSDIDIIVLFKNRLPIIPDKVFASDMRAKYLPLINKSVHIVFEKFYFYNIGAEDYYKDVPKHGRVIYQSL